jgi:PST family polysaccharide transporter
LSIAAKAVRGVAWTGITSVSSRIIGLVGTLILVHFVAPDDYGTVQAASALIATATTFSNFGIGLFVIRNPKETRAVTFHATVVFLALGILSLLIVLAFRDELGPFFEAPALGAFVPLLALAAVFERLTIIPERILQRQLVFTTPSIGRMAGELTYTAVSVIAAWKGAGGWSIVWGNVARSFVRMVIVLRPVPWRDWLEPHRLTKDVIVTILTFGGVATVGIAANFASRRWDNLLVSRLFGPDVLGAYALAFNLADVPATQIAEPVTDVVMASQAHMDEDLRRRSLTRIIGILALVTFPFVSGLACIAPSMTHAFFTRAWAGVGPMLTILSIGSMPRPLAMALGDYLFIQNRQVALAKLECFNVVALLGGIATLGRGSPYAACAVVAAMMFVRTGLLMWMIRVAEGTPIRGFLRVCVGPLLACVPMVAAVVGVHELGGRLDLHPLVQLAAETVVGALVYVGAALVLARAASAEFLRLVRKALRRGEA